MDLEGFKRISVLGSDLRIGQLKHWIESPFHNPRIFQEPSNKEALSNNSDRHVNEPCMRQGDQRPNTTFCLGIWNSSTLTRPTD